MLSKLLATYGFCNAKAFALSMFPSVKYDAGAMSVITSCIIGCAVRYLGLTPLLVAVMIVAVFAEMLTGIRASSKQGKAFESFRFSRGILKICVWCVIFFIFHSFGVEMSRFEGWVYALSAVMFQVLHASSMIWFAIENGTSILENQAVIDGKPKTAYVEAVKAFWDAFVSACKTKISKS